MQQQQPLNEPFGLQPQFEGKRVLSQTISAAVLPTGEEVTLNLPSGQHPSALPGARVTEWTPTPTSMLPSELPPPPPGFRTVQYERDIEVDLASLNLAPTTYVTTPVMYETYQVIKEEPRKPEVKVESTAVPPIPFETKVNEFPGGEEVISVGPHGEEIKTTVKHYPGGGGTVETKLKDPLIALDHREDITTRTIITEPDGSQTTIKSETLVVPDEGAAIRTQETAAVHQKKGGKLRSLFGGHGHKSHT